MKGLQCPKCYAVYVAAVGDKSGTILCPDCKGRIRPVLQLVDIEQPETIESLRAAISAAQQRNAELEEEMSGVEAELSAVTLDRDAFEANVRDLKNDLESAQAAARGENALRIEVERHNFESMSSAHAIGRDRIMALLHGHAKIGGSHAELADAIVRLINGDESSGIKACPFCGYPGVLADANAPPGVRCSNSFCWLQDERVYIGVWNTRPTSICEHCLGKGWYAVQGPTFEYADQHQEQCEKCDGTGIARHPVAPGAGERKS